MRNSDVIKSIPTFFKIFCRHPSNLMLDRLTGRILHIDFGDCFEVAMTREKFPEKIPFRLTRMLTNAMEVKELEGAGIRCVFILLCRSPGLKATSGRHATM